jgi:hypothetical protein
LLENRDGSFELYNMVDDEFEQNNMADSHVELVQSLSRELKQWWDTVPAQPDESCFSEVRNGKGGK